MYVQISGDGFEDIAKAVEFLQTHKVLIGIPQAEASRESGDLTNVDLAFIHSNGSPLNRIPARPFLEPAIAETQDQIVDHMKAAAACAVEGDLDGAMAALDDAGTVGENAAVKRVGGGGMAPNAPITINGGWMRNRKSGKPFKVEGKHSSAPLIDTGSLKGSITHVIEGE